MCFHADIDFGLTVLHTCTNGSSIMVPCLSPGAMCVTAFTESITAVWNFEVLGVCVYGMWQISHVVRRQSLNSVRVYINYLPDSTNSVIVLSLLIEDEQHSWYRTTNESSNVSTL